ncbi:MAG: carboxypeptidase-like regulatory domain-containing protein [Acidobacteriota bacterium]
MKTTNQVRTMLWTAILVGLASVVNMTAQVASGGQFTLDKCVTGSGTQSATGGQYNVAATVGQPFAGQRAVSSPNSVHAGFWNAADSGPLAAMVTVGGQVQTSDGRGIRNVRLTITNPNGSARSTLTGPFGYFRFDDIEAGQTYIIRISSKLYQFANETHIVSVGDEITDLVFAATPN